MPSWFPENNTPAPGDDPLRSLQKIVSVGVEALGASDVDVENARVTSSGKARATDDGGIRVVDV